jgi:hypothetical protein
MTNILNFIDETNDELRRVVAQMQYVPCEELGLDRRAGYRVWVDEECIVIDKANDRALQYYGGFEYVDKECRIEMGDYVIYTAGDARVVDHIETYYDGEDDLDQGQEDRGLSICTD